MKHLPVLDRANLLHCAFGCFYQFFNGCLLQDIFMAAVGILLKLVKLEDHAVAVACSNHGSLMKQWEGIAQIIGRKIEMERKYIARLEGELTCQAQTWGSDGKHCACMLPYT